MTRAELQTWIDTQDWPAIFAAAQSDIAEALTQLRQERVVCREWLEEPMI